MSKKKNNRDGIIFSTNRDFQPDEENEETPGTLSPGEQQLRVHRETKHRGGKTVVLVKGFEGSDEDLKDLGKLLKNKCGTGGSVSEGEILIQGDIRDKVMKILADLGYGVKRGGG